jgi:hypothetical protein
MKIIKDQVMELWFTEKIEFMRECGLWIREIKKGMKDTAMAIHMKGIFKKVKLMVKEFIIGLMVKYMMENGVKELKMVTECGKEFLVTVIWDNG